MENQDNEIEFLEENNYDEEIRYLQEKKYNIFLKQLKIIIMINIIIMAIIIISMIKTNKTCFDIGCIGLAFSFFILVMMIPTFVLLLLIYFIFLSKKRKINGHKKPFKPLVIYIMIILSIILTFKIIDLRERSFVYIKNTPEIKSYDSINEIPKLTNYKNIKEYNIYDIYKNPKKYKNENIYLKIDSNIEFTYIKADIITFLKGKKENFSVKYNDNLNFDIYFVDNKSEFLNNGYGFLSKKDVNMNDYYVYVYGKIKKSLKRKKRPSIIIEPVKIYYVLKEKQL